VDSKGGKVFVGRGKGEGIRVYQHPQNNAGGTAVRRRTLSYHKKRKKKKKETGLELPKMRIKG